MLATANAIATVIAALGIALVAYSYVAYPLLLLICSAGVQVWKDAGYVFGKRNRRADRGAGLPTVAVVISAYNEEAHIRARLENLLQLDYPPGLLRIYVGSDGSADATARLMASVADSRIRCFVFERNRGKASVLNDLVAEVAEDIVVFSDANSVFDRGSLLALVAPFADPRVGCVSGELRLAKGAGDNQDSLYWRFEQFLKFGEARIGGLLGANGAIYAIRRRLWSPLRRDTICDDFAIAMDVCAKGYRLVYQPEAIATEVAPQGIDDEYRRRVRIGIGNFQALVRHPEYFFRTTGIVAFTYLSHKILRWTAPHLLLLSLAASALLALQSPAWLAFTLLQVTLYSASALAFLVSARAVRLPGLLRIPAFLFALNWAFLVASVRFAAGRYRGGWERSAR